MYRPSRTRFPDAGRRHLARTSNTRSASYQVLKLLLSFPLLNIPTPLLSYPLVSIPPLLLSSRNTIAILDTGARALQTRPTL